MTVVVEGVVLLWWFVVVMLIGCYAFEVVVREWFSKVWRGS